MLKSLMASALFAGLGAGLFAALLQLGFLVPLIVEAERYESGEIRYFGAAPVGTEATPAPAEPGHAGHAGHPAAAAPGEGTPMSRHLLTILTTILTYSGFGLMLVAGFALAERAGFGRVDPARGLAWGLAGFTATMLMPSLGLAPELPGAGAAVLEDRQLWWLLTAGLTTAGLGLAAFGRGPLRLGGLGLIALPHLFGAPLAAGYEGVVPPELSALFAARVLAVGALAWAALGALAGHFWSREAQAA